VKKGLAKSWGKQKFEGFLLDLRARDILKYFYDIFKE
jgi:hypothetical protein